MKRIYFAILLALATVFAVSAQGINPMSPIPADKAVRVGKLDNGLTYYIRHNAKPENQAEFYLQHNVGAIQEEDSQIGLAHFLEHMAFNGTKNLPGKMLIDYLETIGVKFGVNLNAGTGQDMTLYNMSAVPLTRESIIDSCLLILHDWSYFLTLDSDEINKERGVIVEELRTHNNADFRVQEKVKKVMFNDSKYAYRNIIGDEEHLRNFSYDELRNFYHRWYRTDLQAIIIVGDFDIDMMENKVRSVMKDIPAVENPQEKVMYPIQKNETPLIAVETDPELTSSEVVYMIKQDPMPIELNNTYMRVMFDYLSGAVTLIGNHRLAEITQKPNAPFIHASLARGDYTPTLSVFMASVAARDGETAKAFDAIYKEVERIRRYGFTYGEVERAKADLLRVAELAYDGRDDRRSAAFVGPCLGNFSTNASMPDAETSWEIAQQIIGSLQADNLNDFAKQYLAANNEVVMITSPEKDGVVVPTANEIQQIIKDTKEAEIETPAEDVEKKPLISNDLKGGKVIETKQDHFGATIWTLDNGATVIVKPTKLKSDELLIGVHADGGLSSIGDTEYPSGELLEALSSQSGVGEFSMTDLQKQLSGISARIGISINNYSRGLNGLASVKNVETLLQLAYLHFTSPRFNEDDFNIMIDKYGSQLTNSENNPEFIYSKNITETVYGNNSRRQVLTLDRLNLVKFEHMEPIYKKLFNNVGDFTFVFVGNVDLETFKPLIEKYIGSIPAGTEKLVRKDDGVRAVKGEVTNRFQIPMRSPKNSILFRYSGDLKYSPKSVLTIKVLEEILEIRYNEAIREEKGGTYGVQVSGGSSKYPVETYTLIIMFDTDPVLADELMVIVGDEMEKLAENGPKLEDLAKIKEYLTKQHPDNLKKNSTWLGNILNYHIYGIDFDKDYEKLVKEMSPEKIQTMVKKILKDNNLIKVIMDSKEITEE